MNFFFETRIRIRFFSLGRNTRPHGCPLAQTLLPIKDRGQNERLEPENFEFNDPDFLDKNIPFFMNLLRLFQA